MKPSSIRVAAVAALSGGAFALLADPTQAAPVPTRGSMILTAFVQSGRTDVRRNEMLTFKFSTAVRKGTCDDRTVRVNQISGTGSKPAIGARIVKGNIVSFDPTRTQKNYNESRKPNTTVVDKDNPEGYVSYQDYEIELPATPDLHVIKNTNGSPLSQLFTGTFRTNQIYFDPVPGQPYFVGDHGSGTLGFQPPKSGATGLVDEDAIVVLEFSEPILVDSIDPGSSLIVTRITVGEQVPGYVKQDPNEPSGRRFLFIPSVGFGSDEANKSGWDIQIQVTSDIMDLAGNRLKRPVTFPVFRTRYASGKRSASLVTESFANQTKMDPSTIAQGGEWNTIEKGACRGGQPTTYPNVDVQYTTANTGITVVRTRVAEPLVAESVPSSGGGGCTARPQGSRAQMFYVPADVGVAAAIVAIAWGPSSNALFAATHPEVTLNLGHTGVNTLGADFTANINVATPLQVYKGLYNIPQAKNIQPPGLDTGYWDWPAFTTPFEWNGTNNLVFDAACVGANNCQILRVGFVPAGIAFPNRRAVSLNSKSGTAEFATDTVVYDIRFKKRRRTTRAISLWYEVASDNPSFAVPIVSPVGQPGGVSVMLEMEGAHGKPDPFNVGGFIADPTTATGFSTNQSLVDGHRFFRFRLSMFANLTTNQTARVASVQFPYEF
jgi:hypothetical protein